MYLPAASWTCGESDSSFLYHEHDFDEEAVDGRCDFISPLALHPDTLGMAHVIGIDQMISWLKDEGDEVQFCNYENVAREW